MIASARICFEPVGPRLCRPLRDHVPEPRFQHEAERLEHAVGDLGPALVGHGDLPLGPYRVRDLAQRLHRLGGLEPAARIEMEARAHPPRLVLPVGRQRREQLQLRVRHRVAEPELGRRSGQTREEQRLRLRRGQPGQPRSPAFEQRKAAVAADIGINRHPGRAELVDVAIDGADRDFELFGQRLGGHPAAALEQHHDGEKAARTHISSLAG